MGNVSKTLIIVGVILIVVVLVSLGIMLYIVAAGATAYNEAAGIAEGTNDSIESLAVEGFNAQFSDYLGERVRKSIVDGLIVKVIANNQQSDIIITLTGIAGSAYAPTTTSASTQEDLTKMRDELTSENTVYKVEVSSLDTSGAITGIQITGVAK